MEGLDLANMLNEFFALLLKNHVQLPADLVFLIKALVTIQGVGQELDPKFDLVMHVEPHLRRLIMSRYSPEEIRKRTVKAASSYLELIEVGPAELRKLLNTVKRGDLALQLRHAQLEQSVDSLGGSVSFLGWCVVVSSAAVALSILMHGVISRR